MLEHSWVFISGNLCLSKRYSCINVNGFYERVCSAISEFSSQSRVCVKIDSMSDKIQRMGQVAIYVQEPSNFPWNIVIFDAVKAQLTKLFAEHY